jgi:predicted MPP superfamily phosphohydrolase
MAEDDARKKQIKDKMFKLAYLENSRMIYDFMEELSDRCSNLNSSPNIKWKYEGYIGIGGLSKRFEKINLLSQKVKEEIEPCYDSDNLLYQNPLHTLLVFYNDVLEEKGERDAKYYYRIAEMLNYFNIMRFLSEVEFKEKRHDAFESLQYIFEDLCFSLKNMTDTNACYIVYKKEGENSQLVARSGYVVANDSDAYNMDGDDNRYCSLNIGSAQFDQIIIEPNKTNYGVKDIGDVIEIKGKYFLRIKLLLKPVDDDLDKQETINYKREFYILLELDKEYPDGEVGKKLLRILFLRNRLLDVLKKYYSGLINFRYYCNYVQSVNENYGENKKIKVLHISDLHINDDDTWSERGAKQNNKWAAFKDKWEKENNKKAIDLLAVTGDVVNGSDDAVSAQRKYRRVANLLLKIAVTLWGYSDKGEKSVKYLSHDWRRRILITTGNHDYDAMNDIKVQIQSRRVQAGAPAMHSGGTMSKFTYFIEFLTYFLDAPTYKLLRDDLNEIREYRNLNNLIVGVFNTCSKANALQNNKVCFDEERLQAVMEDSSWKKSKGKHLVLMHHPPQLDSDNVTYKIDYFDDKYEIWKHSKICGEKYKDEIDDLYKAFLIELEGYLLGKNTIYTSKSKGFSQLFKKLKKDLYQNPSYDARSFLESQIFYDMEMFVDILDKKVAINDYAENFKNTALGLFNVIGEDRKNFNKNCNDILRTNGWQYLVLAGHIHQNSPDLGTKVDKLSVVAKLYDNKNGCEFINYRIIVI